MVSNNPGDTIAWVKLNTDVAALPIKTARRCFYSRVALDSTSDHPCDYDDRCYRNKLSHARSPSIEISKALL